MPDSSSYSADLVLIASGDYSKTNEIKQGLPPATETHVAETFSFDALSREIRVFEPNVLIVTSETASPQLMRAIDQTLKTTPLPILLFVDEDPDHFAARAVRMGVSAFVVNGLISSRIITLMRVAIERFKLNEALQNELQKSKDTLMARKAIEQAKGLLMSRQNLSEQDAYRKLRSMAMRQGKPLKEIADTVLSMSDLLP